VSWTGALEFILRSRPLLAPRAGEPYRAQVVFERGMAGAVSGAVYPSAAPQQAQVAGLLQNVSVVDLTAAADVDMHDWEPSTSSLPDRPKRKRESPEHAEARDVINVSDDDDDDNELIDDQDYPDQDADFLPDNNDNDDEETSVEPNTAVMSWLRSHEHTEVGHRRAMAKFFATTEDAIQSGVRLPGTSVTLRPHQLSFVFHYVTDSVAKGRGEGKILADSTGLGKTYCCLGLYAVIRLILLSARHEASHPERHRAPGTSDDDRPCLLGNAFGIQCACEPRSLSRRFKRCLTGGPGVITTLASNAERWAQEAAAFFNAPGTPLETDLGIVPLSTVVLYSDAACKGYWARPDGKYATSAFDKSDLTSTPLVSGGVSQPMWKTFMRARASPNDQLTYEYIRAKLDSSVTISASNQQATMAKDQSRYLLILSSNAFSNSASRYELAAYAGVPVDRRTAPARVKVPFAIAASLFVFDEAHTITGMTTSFWNGVRDLQDFNTIDGAAPGTKWCFATATPCSNNISSLMAMVSVLCRGDKGVMGKLTRLSTSFQTILLQLKRGDNPEMASFGRCVGNWLLGHGFVIARGPKSKCLGQVIQSQDILLHASEIMVSVPADAEEAMNNLTRICRSAIQDRLGPGAEVNSSQLETITKLGAFSRLFESAIVPGIALALQQHGSAYPAASADVSADLAKPGDESMLRRCAGVHDGHQWVGALVDIILQANRDRGKPGSPERVKHVLVMCQTAGLSANVSAVLEKHPQLQGVARIERVDVETTKKARERDGYVQAISKESVVSMKTTVLLSTPKLMGIGINSAVFCNYLVLFGAFYVQSNTEQVIGRVQREKQQFPVHLYKISSSHTSHEIVRRKSVAQSLMLSDFGLGG
jgi:hypothetical protein